MASTTVTTRIPAYAPACSSAVTPLVSERDQVPGDIEFGPLQEEESVPAAVPALSPTEVIVPFAGDLQTRALVERDPAGTWLVYLQLDDTLYAEGDTLRGAVRNLMRSAQEVKDLLEGHQGRLSRHLERQRQMLRYLLG